MPREFGLGAFRANTRCPGEQDPHRHVRAVTAALLPRLAAAPDLLVVQGDTSSAIGAALAAFTARVPVAHVEAGLRTHDSALPWPEEEYRTAIDAGADCCSRRPGPPRPTSARRGPRRDPRDRQYRQSTRCSPERQICRRAGNGSATGRLSSSPAIAAKAGAKACSRSPPPSRELAGERGHRLRPSSQSACRREMRRLLASVPGVSLLEPCGHRSCWRMRDCRPGASDSGGIQEEAPTLGVPLLVLREKTERPEGIAAGCARLVGTSTARISAKRAACSAILRRWRDARAELPLRRRTCRAADRSDHRGLAGERGGVR